MPQNAGDHAGSKPRMALTLVLLLVLAGLPGGPGGAMAEPARPLRYVSLNILHGGILSGVTGDDQDLELRLRIVGEELRALDPDVIGLQEASVGRRRGNVAERLAARLGFHYAHVPVRWFDFEWLNRLTAWIIDIREGPAILSRYPILDWEAHHLDRCAGRFEPRALVYARLRTPWGELPVASTHTSRGFCEAREVARILHRRQGVLPTVLMGDFNATEDSAGVQTLTNGAGFVDTFRAANPDATGATVWQQVYAPVSTARRRVDFLFMLPGTGVPGRVLRSRVVLDAPRPLDNGKVLWPSDHYGIFTELDLGKT
jgi:endonuclease/exonuclease/phosphatase family metal-dependent hydrolase